jgi:hypothetical protein
MIELVVQTDPCRFAGHTAGSMLASPSTSDFILEYAAWLELVEGFPRHYVRINPTNVKLPGPVRCRRDGVCFERVEPAFQRYVVNPGPSRHEIWSFRHQLRQMPRQKILRIIVAAEATVAWSADHWATANKSDTMNRTGLNLWFADLATKDLPDGSVVEFTFFWEDTQRWEGRNWQIDIEQL